MTETPVYHTKGKDDWGTEQALYDALDSEFAFTLDAAADGYNAKTHAWLSEGIDALSVDWWGRVFMNPPHSKVDKFLVKMVKEFLAGRIEIGVALVASRTDTAAHHMMTSYAGETRYLAGRVRYELFPSEKQRIACATLAGITIEDGAWPELVKTLKLPKTAIKRLIQDPNYIGPDLAMGAPFPSVVFILDGRKHPSTVYWDWRKKTETLYVFKDEGFPVGPVTSVDVKSSPWLKIKMGGFKGGKATTAKALIEAGKAQQAAYAAIHPGQAETYGQLKLVGGDKEW